MKLKHIILLLVIALVTLLFGCNYEENKGIFKNSRNPTGEITTLIGTDINSGENVVKFHKIFDGYLTSESNEDRPEEVVYCFNDTLKWDEFRMKYLESIDIPRIDLDSYNKTLLCLFTLQAIPYKLSQVDIQEIYNDGSDNYILLDSTGVVEESDSVWISQVILLTVDADDFHNNMPINIVMD